MTELLPLSLQTTYQELLEAHLQRAVDPLEGAPTLLKRNGRGYWYRKLRIGERTIQRYIGPDSPEMRMRMEQARERREDQKAFERRCGMLAAQLRAARLPAPARTTARVLDAMAKVGVFRLGGTLVGPTPSACMTLS